MMIVIPSNSASKKAEGCRKVVKEMICEDTCV